MSGLNAMAGANNLPMRQFSPGDAAKTTYQTQIRNYCNEHLLLPYYSAVTEIYNALPLSAQETH